MSPLTGRGSCAPAPVAGRLAALEALLCRDRAAGPDNGARFELLAVPGKGRARYVVPAGPAAQRTAVSCYPGLRNLRRRALRWSAAITLDRSGVARLVSTAVGWEAPAGSLLGVLADQFGPGLQISGRVPAPGQHRPGLLTLLDGDDRIQGFAKFGDTPAAQRLLQREATALRLAEGLPSFAAAPRLLLDTTVGPVRCLVIAPLPASARRAGRRERAVPSWQLVEAVSRLAPPGGDAAEYLDGLEARLAGLPAGIDLHAWRRRTLRARHLPVGCWHGDLTPWNMATDGTRVWIWDWEHSRSPVPLGFDLLQHYYQVARVRFHVGVPAALRFREAGRHLLAAAGLGDVAPLLLRLHEWELQARAAERCGRPGASAQGASSCP